MTITRYGTKSTENGQIIITNYGGATDPETDDDGGHIAIYLDAEWESVALNCALDFAGENGAFRNLVGIPTGLTQFAVQISDAILVPATPNDEAEVEEVIRLLANWGHTVTNFPYRLYWDYTGSKNYHQFVNQATTGKNPYMKGAAGSFGYQRTVQDFKIPNLAFLEYFLGGSG